jgi:hypothetical protein
LQRGGASVDTQGDFYYVRAVNFEDFYPSLGTSYDMDLLISINDNWGKEMDPTQDPHVLDAVHTSRSPRINPTDEDVVFFNAIGDAPVKYMPVDV